MAPPTDRSTALTPRGEVVLRRRPADGALELRVNGVFVMDDRHTATERILARAALDELGPAGPPLRVVVGGLGLGFTLAEVLAEPRTGAVVVVELEAAVVDWHAAGLVPGSPLGDARVEVVVGDVLDVIPTLPPASVDLVLLDVDNGPALLVNDRNAKVYRRPFLGACREVLAPDGIVAIWSADPSADLASTLDDVFGGSAERVVSVSRGAQPTTLVGLGRSQAAPVASVLAASAALRRLTPADREPITYHLFSATR